MSAHRAAASGRLRARCPSLVRCGHSLQDSHQHRKSKPREGHRRGGGPSSSIPVVASVPAMNSPLLHLSNVFRKHAMTWMVRRARSIAFTSASDGRVRKKSLRVIRRGYYTWAVALGVDRVLLGEGEGTEHENFVQIRTVRPAIIGLAGGSHTQRVTHHLKVEAPRPSSASQNTPPAGSLRNVRATQRLHCRSTQDARHDSRTTHKKRCERNVCATQRRNKRLNLNIQCSVLKWFTAGPSVSKKSC